VLQRRGKGWISEESFIAFVDDGSKDRTWNIIQELHLKHPKRVKGIKLSRNCGHQNALMAGMLSFDYDACVTMDADLQDPPEVIEKMVEKYKEGYEIVYGVRSKRDTDTMFKRKTAEIFYKLMRILGVELVNNHADFRLMGKRAVNALSEFKESNLFLRGIIPYLGFKSTKVFYERRKRAGGESKYTLGKMISFAWEGITSLSLWALYLKLSGKSVAGWTSIVLSLYILGGLNILFLGIIGEYIGKTYIETKKRPRYIVEEKLD